MAAATKRYEVTDVAGRWVAGRMVRLGDFLDLTENEARYELLAGAIVPLGGVPIVPAEPKILTSDSLVLTRGGVERQALVYDLLSLTQDGSVTEKRTEVVITAMTNIGGHKAVRGTPDGAAYASVAEASHVGTVLGVTTGAASSGAAAIVVSSGGIDEPSWSWTRGPVWLGLDGALSQDPPAGAFVQQIGVAVGPTRLIVSLGPPIRTV